MNGLKEVKLRSTSKVFVSFFVFVSRLRNERFSFLVASDKHPIFDENEGFNLQNRQMLLPLKNKTSSISTSVSAIRSESQNGKNSITSVASNQRIPLGEIQRNSLYQLPPKIMRTNSNETIGIPQKENVNYFGQYGQNASFEKMLTDFVLQIMSSKRIHRSII